jgi:hypothetical protein
MDGPFEVIDAFVDGEYVDPSALKRALAEPEGRDYFVDAWLLRDRVQEEDAASRLPRLANRPLDEVRGGRSRWLVAAAVAGVCLIGGYLTGFQFARSFGARTVEPAPVAVEAAPPAPPPTSFPVPPATRVIRLELDMNWKERGGGN